MKYEIYAIDKTTGVDIGYIESCDTNEKALLKIKELKKNEKYNEWNYGYKIYQSIK